MLRSERITALVLTHVPAGAVRAIAHQRRSRPWLARLTASLARSGSRVEVRVPRGPARGLRFASGGAALSYALGTIEPEVQETLARVVAPGDVAFDLGASTGFYSLLLGRAVGPDGAVHAFEPLDASVAEIRANAARNGLDNVRVHACAVGARDGEQELVWASGGAFGRLRGDGEPEAAGADSILTVPVRSLDSVVRAGDAPAPRLVKIDVEGAELDVIAGMRGLIADRPPIIVCELHGTNRAFAALMRELDYAIEPIDDRGPVEEAFWNVHVLCRPHRAASA